MPQDMENFKLVNSGVFWPIANHMNSTREKSLTDYASTTFAELDAVLIQTISNLSHWKKI